MLCLRSWRAISPRSTPLRPAPLSNLAPLYKRFYSPPPPKPQSLPLLNNPIFPPSSFSIHHPPCRPRINFPALPATCSPAVDRLPKISLHPSLANVQVRNGPRDTYNPSHRVRKRRHGFLARLRTRNGRAILMRRKLKRRSTLSH